jgi:hypothetical protein
MRPAKLWPKLLKQTGQREDFKAHGFRQFFELGIKLVSHLYNPTHHSQYVIKDICCQGHILGGSPT